MPIRHYATAAQQGNGYASNDGHRHLAILLDFIGLACVLGCLLIQAIDGIIARGTGKQLVIACRGHVPTGVDRIGQVVARKRCKGVKLVFFEIGFIFVGREQEFVCRHFAHEACSFS